MLDVSRVVVFLVLQIIIVQCVIPNLQVRKVDQRTIQRKRMDTVEMCRIFEKERQKAARRTLAPKSRSKREIKGPKFGGIPTLRDEDVRKVESIVDRLYDDMMENGEKVTYRQRNITTTTPREIKLNEDLFNHTGSGRRFDFAPQFLTGPGGGDYKPGPPETVPVPWIKKWKHAIIPYFIDPKTYDNGLAEVIMSAFDYFERATCIRLQRLREKPQDRKSMEHVEWIYITNPTGIRQCVHSNERIPNKGVQMVVFGYECMSRGEIAHEVMHILGFSHEHNRPDRDQHISIMWDNIKPGYKKYFEARRDDPLLRLKYDYHSVLHYPPRAFSKNGQVTVNAKTAQKVGQREGLSETDIEKVALIFGNECVDRNKEYLLTTCPSVVKVRKNTKIATQNDIQHYFKDRIWPYGIVNYKLRDIREFSSEERDNIHAVINHIQRETCIEFKDMAEEEEADQAAKDAEDDDDNNGSGKDDNSKKSEDEKQSGDDDKEKDVNEEKNEKEKLNLEVNPENEQGENAIPVGSTEVTNNVFTDTNTPGDDETTATELPDTPEEVEQTEANTDATTEAPVEDITTSIAGEVVTDDPATPEGESTQNPEQRLRFKRSAKSGRRHAAATLIFTRSAEPGCKCPKPGKSEDETAVIELSQDCFNSVNDLLHVFVHILGLDHQHNMHDRDDFLHIVWDKLTPDVKEEMQQKLPPEAAIGFPYDYQSVMHYPWLQIKNGVTNIMYPIWNDGWAMGHWQGLSATDVQKLSLLYYEQCLERKKQEEAAEKEE